MKGRCLMRLRTTLCVAGILALALSPVGRADVTFTDDFGTVATWLRWGPSYGSRGWYSPFNEVYGFVTDTNAVPGMSGAVARIAYDSMYQALALRPLPAGATNLTAFKRVELEVSVCMTNAPYGGGLFLVRNTYFVDTTWYGSPIQYLNYDGVGMADWFGVWYYWASYEAGVTVAQPALVAAGNTVATGIRATCLDPDKTYRIRISFDLQQNRMKLEQKVFDSVGGTWGNWTTAIDWVPAGFNLTAVGLNAMMIDSYNVTPHATYNTYLDDFSLLAVPPKGTVIQFH
jgi:hypothetical protein